jgi:hypothetical protein
MGETPSEPLHPIATAATATIDTNANRRTCMPLPLGAELLAPSHPYGWTAAV